MSASKIGRYEIIGTLGKGAMGVVYKAVDPTIGRTVALKTTRLDIHGSDAEEMLARFRNEARLAGVLHHPNIVTVYDAGEFESLFYIAMEFIEGETLHQILTKKKTLPIEQAIDIVGQICSGLDEAAKNQVVHRDIKPANIMIEASGTAKIMDFGIAKSGGGLTSTGQVLGTPNYMSPEQVRGRPLDGRSDLFSLGVVLYEMVTGAKPFIGDNVTTIIYKIINETPAPPRDLNAAVHPGMNSILAKALAKTPGARYQSGAEFAQALQNYKALISPQEPTVRIAAGAPAAAVAAAAGTLSAPKGAENGAAKLAAAAATVPTGKHPSAVQKLAEVSKAKVPLLPIFGGIIVLLGLVAGGIVAYVHYSQSQQRAELERLLTQEKPAAPAAAVTQPTNAQPSQPQNASPVGPPSTGAPARASADETTPDENTVPETRTSSSKSRAGEQAATPATGELVLNTDPAGAQIQIDGRGNQDWHTPFNASGILPGPHTVTFNLPGYVSETRIVAVDAGKQAFIAVGLKQQLAAASVSSTPSGAEIFVDGADSGKQTPAKLQVAQGDHNLVLRKSGYMDLMTTAHVTGAQYGFSGNLESGAKTTGFGKFKKIFSGDRVPLEVKTRPRGAQVVINGVAESQLSPMRMALEPGTYDVTLRLNGYKPLHKTVTLDKDTPLQMDEVLEKQ